MEKKKEKLNEGRRQQKHTEQPPIDPRVELRRQLIEIEFLVMEIEEHEPDEYTRSRLQHISSIVAQLDSSVRTLGDSQPSMMPQRMGTFPVCDEEMFDSKCILPKGHSGLHASGDGNAMWK